MNCNIRVSVCVVTYNQERYIGQCLQSILDQETDFDFEIIIGDDCSTDKTKHIVQEFADKYPDKIHALFQEKNIGPALNYAKTHSLAQGLYIAHLDGDDIALPGKLKLQHDILENNPNCVLVSHDMKLLVGDKLLRRTFKRHRDGINSLSDLYNTLPFFAHSSKMVRADIDKKSLFLIEDNTFDIELHVMMAKHGDIYHIDEPLGIYRSGVGVSNLPVNKVIINAVAKIYESAINEGYDLKKTKKAYAKHMFGCAYRAAIVGNIPELRSYINKSMSINIISLSQVLFYILSFCPPIVVFLCKLRAVFNYKIRG